MAVIIFIYLFLSSRLCENRTAQNMAEQKTRVHFFLFYLFFAEELPLYLQQVGHNMTVIIYIYLYIEMFEVAWEPNGSKYGKTKKHVFPIFGFSIFFVEEPPLYLQQGGHKTAFVKNIYRRSSTKWLGISKNKNTQELIFWISFFL